MMNGSLWRMKETAVVFIYKVRNRKSEKGVISRRSPEISHPVTATYQNEI